MKRKLVLTWALLGLTLSSVSSQILSVGDAPPPVSVFKWIKGGPVDVFEKGKVHVVEFGATWCAPCAAAIPKLSNLANKYKDAATVTSIFVMERSKEVPGAAEPGYVSHVEKYVRKRWDMISYHVAVDDVSKNMENRWLRAAGKIGVPYIFIIDKQGRIAWIGSQPSAVDSLVSLLTTDNTIQSKTSSVPFDNTKLYLLNGNGGDDNDFAFRSVIAKFKGDFRSASPQFIRSPRALENAGAHYRDRVQVIGTPLERLYYLAYGDTLWNRYYSRNPRNEYTDTIRNPDRKHSYGKWWHRAILEVSDTSPFVVYRGSPVNKYNYSLKVPEGLGWAKFLQEAMQRDLKTYFGFDACVETRMMPYWKLSLLSEKKLAIAKSSNQEAAFSMDGSEMPFIFKNAITRDVIWMLAANYGFIHNDYGRLPINQQGAFIDESGVTCKFDFKFDPRLSFDDQVKQLNEIGFDLRRAYKPMKVVVIRDP